MMKKLIALACLASLALIGCDDDNDKKSDGCTANVCEGNVLKVCGKSGNYTSITCPNGCDATKNVCKTSSSGGSSSGGDINTGDPNTPTSGSCDPKAYPGACSADGSKRYYCSSSGSVVEKTCSAGTTCNIKGANSTECKSTGSSSGSQTGTTVTTGGTANVDKCVVGQYTATCINGGANAMVCYNGTVKKWTCADNQCTVNGSTADCPKTSSSGGGSSSGSDEDDWNIDENLDPVPNSQNNTAGADCDPETFVEHCNGNTVVYCSCQPDATGEACLDANDDGKADKYIVAEEPCADQKCWTYRAHEYDYDDNFNYVETAVYNYAYCYESCDTLNAEVNMCNTDYYGADILENYVCKETKAGKLYLWNDDAYCATPCSNNTCTKNKSCDEDAYTSSCKSGVAYNCDYDDYFTDTYIQVMNCAAYEAECVMDDGYATCDWGDDDEDDDFGSIM